MRHQVESDKKSIDIIASGSGETPPATGPGGVEDNFLSASLYAHLSLLAAPLLLCFIAIEL